MTFDGAQGGSMTSVKSLVDQKAAQYGVPAWIAEDIVQEESGGNPRAVGDRGTSFGLLQLHRGGQAGNRPTSALENASTNLDIGMPYIARGYNAAKAAGYSGFQLLLHTAGMSGHPGGSPGSYIMTSGYAKGLANIYGKGANLSGSVDTSSASGGSESNTKNPMTFTGGLNGFLSGLDNAMQIDFQWTSPLQSLLNDAGAIAFRTMLVLCGLLLIIFGLVLAVKRLE